ncbi:MAG: hypothetical protein FWD45_01845 [Coriobacteriia bacterium]|nr:hypothetical protein [Coriobacteriia bacterium]
MQQSEEFGTLQRLVDMLFEKRELVTRLDVIILSDSLDLIDDLLEIVNLLPPGTYNRQRLCDQMNSAISGHGWGFIYGTVE